MWPLGRMLARPRDLGSRCCGHPGQRPCDGRDVHEAGVAAPATRACVSSARKDAPAPAQVGAAGRGPESRCSRNRDSAALRPQQRVERVRVGRKVGAGPEGDDLRREARRCGAPERSAGAGELVGRRAGASNDVCGVCHCAEAPCDAHAGAAREDGVHPAPGRRVQGRCVRGSSKAAAAAAGEGPGAGVVAAVRGLRSGAALLLAGRGPAAWEARRGARRPPRCSTALSAASGAAPWPTAPPAAARAPLRLLLPLHPAAVRARCGPLHLGPGPRRSGLAPAAWRTARAGAGGARGGTRAARRGPSDQRSAGQAHPDARHAHELPSRPPWAGTRTCTPPRSAPAPAAPTAGAQSRPPSPRPAAAPPVTRSAMASWPAPCRTPSARRPGRKHARWSSLRD